VARRRCPLRVQGRGVGSRRQVAERGRAALKSSIQPAMTARAWFIEKNRCSFKHSSRSSPWKLSAKAFCVGLPGAMQRRSSLAARARTAEEVNSVP